ncbi:Suppressor of the cold-sensitive snRNP biogenesis mutant brr1-1 [Peltigera leucophlebia]|nr:Suppressor of the cold-sensitive snRNP biogenesis mutant brr1-1 [Peltigera leucophlebia]
MKSDLRLFVASILVLGFDSVWALPDFVAPSGSCDEIYCPGWIDFSGVLDGTSKFFDGLWNTESETTTLPTIPPGPAANPEIPQNPESPDPEIELLVVGENKDSERCNAPTLPGTTPEENLEDPSLRPCEGVKQYLIWPLSCEDSAGNTKTEQMLGLMDSKFRISLHPLCALKDGPSFWLAELTQDQVKTLRKENPAVKMVTTNAPIRFGAISQSPSPIKVPPVRERTHHKKRDTERVYKDYVSDQSLTFLSAPPWAPNSDTYKYFKPAGTGVRVFLIDIGLDPDSLEFYDIPIEWIFALDVDSEKRDEVVTDPVTGVKHYGTCVGSKINGLQLGVSKFASLTVVKIKANIASFLDALQKVVHILEDSLSPTKGWTVINMGLFFKIPDNEEGNAFKEELVHWMTYLERTYEAVVVTTSGIDNRSPYAENTRYPAALSQYGFNIIVVGSVLASNTPNEVYGISNGQRFPWSNGRGVTVSAPGNGECFGPNNMELSHTSNTISTAIVTGLAAYFLSLKTLGNELRAAPSTPVAVKDYLQLMSYNRYLAQASVWNGLDSNDMTRGFVDWVGIPPSKNPPPNIPPPTVQQQ